MHEIIISKRNMVSCDVTFPSGVVLRGAWCLAEYARNAPNSRQFCKKAPWCMNILSVCLGRRQDGVGRKKTGLPTLASERRGSTTIASHGLPAKGRELTIQREFDEPKMKKQVYYSGMWMVWCHVNTIRHNIGLCHTATHTKKQVQ